MAAVDVGSSARIGKRRGNEALLGHPRDDASLTAYSHERVAFSCECTSVGCTEIVWMVESDFRKVARAEGFALVALGHVTDDEQIVACTSDYLLVSRGVKL